MFAATTVAPTGTRVAKLRVSAVIPTYNRAAFLPAAVASIRDQTYPCDEVVIVDDGSSDNTAEVVAALGDGIRYVRQANAGPAAARNRGIREATGELVAFLDTDDRWLPNKLQRQVEIFQREPDVALVSADMAIEDAAGKRIVESNFARRGLRALFTELDGRPVPDAPRRLLKVNFINTSTAVARRGVLLDLDGFDTRLRFGEDLELWLRIAARHPIACVPSVEEIRVEHESNVTRSVEPMLKGYVDLAQVIREWARGQMPLWGITADRYVAACLADLGYWYFSQNRRAEARQVLVRSLKESPSVRALAYLAGAALPQAVINVVRRFKSVAHRDKRHAAL